MNRNEIIETVRDYLNRPNLAEASIQAMISSIEGEFNRMLRDHPRNTHRSTLIVEESVSILPLPSDIAQLIQLRAGEIVYKQYPPDAREIAISHSHSYIELGTCIEIFPTPKENILFTLDYTSFITPLKNATDTNWISLYFADLYLYGILKESSVYLKDDARLQLWEKEFLRRLSDVVAQGWNQNISTAPLIRTDTL